MQINKTTRQRHFPFQHPTFGRGKTKKDEKAWKGTIYYLWWAYLRHNEEYLATCKARGKGSLSALYKDFGDVRRDDFKDWWLTGNRGAELFANPAVEQTIRLVSKDEVSAVSDDVLLLTVPLSLPKRFLVRRFKALLDENHKGSRGKRYAKQSAARYQFNGQPNVAALRTALDVWVKKKENPKMRLWELGQFLPLAKHYYTDYLKSGKPIDTAEKKIMEATVSRYLRKAKQSIANTSKGIFP